MSRRALWTCAGFVVVFVVFAHAGGLDGGFVYDDHRFIEQNEAVASLAHPLRFFTDPGSASAAQGIRPDVWRPLRTFHFAVDRAIFGLAPMGWHLANLALHVANALLVWVLLLRILSGAYAPRAALGAATLCAALFAVHPATVESVAWVSSRGDLLAWTLVLLAFEVLHRPGAARTALGAVLVALACLAKESAVVAFLLLPLRDQALPAATRPPPRTTWARTLVLAGVTAAYFAARLWVMPSSGDLPLLAQTSLPDGGRAAAARGALASLGWYLRVLFVPLGFPFDRNVYTDPIPLGWGEPSVVLGLAVLAGCLVAGTQGLLRRKGAQAFACLGALIAWVPASSLLVPLKAFAAERFLYPVLPCLAAGVAVGAAGVATRLSPRGRLVLWGAGGAVVLALGLLAQERTRPWHDEATLWAAVQRDEPMNPRAYEGLGFLLYREGHLGEAERAFSTYREFQPYDGKVHAELAALFLKDYYDLSTTAEAVSAAPERDRVEAPRFLLRQSMKESRAAMEAWSRAGLERARGDRALVRSNLEGWREAAMEHGDLALAEARVANELLAADDRTTPGAAEAYAERRLRVVLASLVASAPPPRRDGTADLRRDLARRELRAQLLTDVEIYPALSNPMVKDALLPRFAALLAEVPADEAVRRQRVTVHLEAVEAQSGETRDRTLAALETDLALLAAAHPADRGLAQTLAAVRAKRSR